MDSSEIYRLIGIRIRESRIKRHIKQSTLAEIVALTRTSITNIEKGRQKLPIHTLYVLANALGVPPKDLLPEETNTIDPSLTRRLPKDEANFVSAIMGETKPDENQKEDNSKNRSKSA
jgi:transcriptional regulator with XRE-family HTH domain